MATRPTVRELCADLWDEIGNARAWHRDFDGMVRAYRNAETLLLAQSIDHGTGHVTTYWSDADA